MKFELSLARVTTVMNENYTTVRIIINTLTKCFVYTGESTQYIKETNCEVIFIVLILTLDSFDKF